MADDGASDGPVGYGTHPEPFRPAKPPPAIQRVMPVVAHLPRYRRPQMQRDGLAGITVAALALPSGMAYAELAGLSPVAGLYVLLLPAVAYALLGSSRQLVVGPEGVTAVLTATALAPLAAGNAGEYAALAAMLALLTAAFFALARVARIGWIADYFSRPVLVGYLHGVVVILVVGQAGKLLGIPVDADTVPGQIEDLVSNADQADAATAAVGLGALAALLLFRRFGRRLPGALIVVVVAIAVSALFSLSDHGVAVVGDVPSGLPGFDIPTVPWSDFFQLLPAALGIFLVSFSDSILTARSFAGRHGQVIDVNQEMVALASADALAGVTQGFPVSSSGSRTAVNDQMGARTQFAGLIAAAVVAIVLLVLTGPIADLPSACLGAVIIAASIGLVNVGEWRSLWRIDRVEVGITATTVLGVVVLGVLEALVVAVALSVVDAVRRSARPRDAVLGWVARLGRWGDVRLNPSAVVEPGVVVYRLDDRLFFANATYVAGRVREAVAGAPGPVEWVVFDAEAMSHIDTTGIDSLRGLVEGLRAEGIGFAVARLRTAVQDRLEADGLLATIGPANVHPTVRAAVSSCRDQIAAARA